MTNKIPYISTQLRFLMSILIGRHTNICDNKIRPIVQFKLCLSKSLSHASWTKENNKDDIDVCKSLTVYRI